MPYKEKDVAKIDFQLNIISQNAQSIVFLTYRDALSKWMCWFQEGTDNTSLKG